MNRADRQRAQQQRREVLIHQLQERNQELHEKIVRLQREYGRNKCDIEELQELTSEEEYEESVEDISSVELIEPSASNPFITIAQRGDRIGTGAAQIQDSRGSEKSNNLSTPTRKTKKEERKESLQRASAWALERKRNRERKQDRQG